MNALHHRIIDISKKFKLMHVGSSLTSVDIIDDIYSVKASNENFVLSMGHAALALYVVLEKYYRLDAEEIFMKHGSHPERCIVCGIDCSTGSLGHGLPIAVGMALADRSKDVYCLISDGEIYEGSIYEAGNMIRKYDIDNLKVYLNYNGWSAYDAVPEWMITNINSIIPNLTICHTRVEDYGFKGLDAHYAVL